MKRVWIVMVKKNGFTFTLMIEGTETELIDYCNYEFGGGDERHTGNYRYSGATEKEVEAAKLLKMPIYMA